MRQTLFYIPHEFLGVPVFGLLGWSSLVVILIAIYQIVTVKDPTQRNATIQNNLVVWVVMLLLGAFLLPRIETQVDGWPVGLPIRGYGVMLMLGVLSGVWIALKRSEERGISREAFFSLATWTVVAGIVGARLFYVVQHWDTLAGDTFQSKLVSVLQVTEGGLVVYGSVIGGLIAIVYWTFRYRYPLLKVADAVTPAFFIGLAFGRIGCLLNGCCYGGVCETNLPAITFPSGSAVYEEQLASGRLLGLDIDGRVVKKVAPDSWGASHGVTPGQRIDSIQAYVVDGPTKEAPLNSPKFEMDVRIAGEYHRVQVQEMPARSVPVHPSQIYASIGALVLFLWTMSLSPFLKRTGYMFATGLVTYGLVRILEEYIRVDELGQFGTDLSISQWISLIGIGLGIGIAIFAARRRAE